MHLVTRADTSTLVARVDPAVESGLQATCDARSPTEAGGLLFGGCLADSGWVVGGFLEFPNVDPRRGRYRADPTVVRDWVYGLGGRRSQVVGMFHTHPEAVARPSVRDVRLASAGYLHAIVGRPGLSRRIRVYRRERPDDPLTELPVRHDAGHWSYRALRKPPEGA